MTLVIALAVVLALQFAQTAWTLTHADEEGRAIGLHIFQVPLDMVLGSCFYAMGWLLLTGIRQDVAEAIGIGAWASYASVWGRALGFSLIAVRAARHEAVDPARRR